MNSWKDFCGKKRKHNGKRKRKFSFYPNYNIPNYPIDHEIPADMSESLKEAVKILLDD